MPYVNIKYINTGTTDEQRTELISGVTDLVKDVLGRDPATIVVVLDEVPMNMYGMGGESIAARRAAGR